MSSYLRLLLSVSTGILLSLAWLDFPGWSLFFALVPLLIIEHFFTKNKNTYKSACFWGYAFIAFLVWNGLCTWWIAHATIVGALMAIIVNSFLMSVIWWIAHIARRNLKSNLGYLALIVFWISLEFFHFHWDIEWPWLNLGNGFANNIKMIQWYEYTGTLGGTLWVMIVNIIFFNIYIKIQEGNSFKNIIYPATVLLLLITVPIAYSFSVYHNYKEIYAPVNVVVVQPNIDPYDERYDQQAELEKMEKFMRLADTVTDQKTDLVIGPETIFERYFDWNEDRLANNFYFKQVYSWMKKYSSAEVIIGASTSKIYTNTDSITSTARKSNGIFYDVFNSAVFIGRNGNEQLYHKSILVSGVEKMPFLKYLGFLSDLVFDLGGTTGSLGRQDEPSNFTLKNGDKLAPVICYESVFGEYLAKSVKKGAGIIVIITNDGWWRKTHGYKQHKSFARLRAIETRRSVVRSANTGISCLINQRGDVLKKTGWWEEAAIKGTVNYNRKTTFYMKHGDYIARISLFISTLLILLIIVNRIRT